MKKASLIFVLAMSVLTAIAYSETRGQTSFKTVVYYFHGQSRCYSCMRIEELTRKAIQKGFTRDIASGAMTFQPINVDIPKNGHYTNDYGLSTRSVVISKTKDGKEIAWKNLDKVWNYLGNEKVFMDYVINEVRGFVR